MATWKDFVKTAQQNTVSNVTSSVIPALVSKPAPRPAPKIEYPKHYIGPSTKPQMDARSSSIGPAQDRSHRPELGFYGLLGNPGLQRALDAGYNAAQESGSTAARVAAGLGRLPERTVAAAGGAALTGAGASAAVKSAPYAYQAAKTVAIQVPKAISNAAKTVARYRAPVSVAMGGTSGVKEGIETGDIGKGLEKGLRDASLVYLLGGGNLLASSAGIGLSDAVGTTRSTGDIAEGIKSGIVSGATTYGGGRILGAVASRFPKTMATATVAGGLAGSVYPVAKSVSRLRSGVKARDDAIRDSGILELADKAIGTPDSMTPAGWKLVMDKKQVLPEETVKRLEGARSAWDKMPEYMKWRPEQVYTPAYRDWMSAQGLSDIADNWDYMNDDQRLAFQKELAENSRRVWDSVPEERRARIIEKLEAIRDRDRKERMAQIARM